MPSKSAHVSAAPPAAARINYCAFGTYLLLLYMAFADMDRRSYIAKLFTINTKTHLETATQFKIVLNFFRWLS